MNKRAAKHRLENPEKLREAQARYRLEHREKTAERNRRFYQANRERERARAQRWRAENPEKAALSAAKWRSANPERFAAIHRSWRNADPEATKARRRQSYLARRDEELRSGRKYKLRNRVAVAAQEAKRRRENPVPNRMARAFRRAAEKQATPKWADKKKIREVFRLAAETSNLTGVVHHVDHIVPLQSRTVCGLHCEANLQILPGAENQSKSNRSWPDMPEQKRAKPWLD